MKNKIEIKKDREITQVEEIGSTIKWQDDEDRSVTLFDCDDGGVVLYFTRGEKITPLSLSGKATEALTHLLLRRKDSC